MRHPNHLTVVTLLLAACNLSAATLYVSPGSTNPMPPYTSWATAAANIQDAVDAAQPGDTVLVTNGVYAAGQREAFDSSGNSIGTNRVVVTNAINLVSANGPASTVIDAGGSNRCVALSDGAGV